MRGLSTRWREGNLKDTPRNAGGRGTRRERQRATGASGARAEHDNVGRSQGGARAEPQAAITSMTALSSPHRGGEVTDGTAVDDHAVVDDQPRMRKHRRVKQWGLK